MTLDRQPPLRLTDPLKPFGRILIPLEYAHDLSVEYSNDLVSRLRSAKPGDKLSAESPVLIAYREGITNIGKLDATALLELARVGVTFHFAVSGNGERICDAAASLLKSKMIDVDKVTELLRYVGVGCAARSKLLETTRLELLALLSRGGQPELSVHRKLLSSLTAPDVPVGTLAKELFAWLGERTARLLLAIEPDYTSGHIPNQLEVDIAENRQALAYAAERIDLGEGFLISRLLRNRDGSAGVSFARSSDAIRLAVLSLYIEWGLRETQGFRNLVASEGRAVESMAVRAAVNRHLILAEIGIADLPAYSQSAKRMAARISKSFTAACNQSETGALISEFFDLRRSGLGLPLHRRIFENELGSRLTHRGVRSGTQARDAIALGELLVRDRDPANRGHEYSSAFKAIVIRRLDEHLHAPANRAEAVELATWLLLLAPDRVEHCRTILSAEPWRGSIQRTLPTIPPTLFSRRLGYLVGRVLEIEPLTRFIDRSSPRELAARNATNSKEEISFKGTKVSTDGLAVGLVDPFLWSFDACHTLKQEVKLDSSIHASDFGIVDVDIGTSSLVVALPHPGVWDLPKSRGFSSYSEVERELMSLPIPRGRTVKFLPFTFEFRADTPGARSEMLIGEIRRFLRI